MSFGEKLRRERERQRLQLGDVATATKIGTRHLQSIEDEAISRLPGGVFNRGFVRAYAAYLGLDSDELVEDLNTLSETKKPDRGDKNKSLADPENGEAPARGLLRWLSPLL